MFTQTPGDAARGDKLAQVSANQSLRIQGQVLAVTEPWEVKRHAHVTGASGGVGAEEWRSRRGVGQGVRARGRDL